MDTILWKGYEWMMQETWGQIHPKKPQFWYDETAVEIDKKGYLHLKTHFNPKPFIIGDKSVLSLVGAGLVCCMHPFHFGHYRIIARFPSGQYLFPAIWMYDLDVWPPEIDIVEGYSNQLGNYLNFNPFRMLSLQNIWSNFHYRDGNGNHVKVGNRPNNIMFRDPSKNFLLYEMTWSPNRIELFLEGRSTRRLDGPLMQYFQKPMRFLMNNGYQNNKTVNESQQSDFVIRDFVYTKA